MKLGDIHFHDSKLVRVVELVEQHDLLFEVEYPVDWEHNVFESRVIAFRDVLYYRVAEGPFVGAPTLLDAYDCGQAEGNRQVTLQTNAGTRSLHFRAIELLACGESPEAVE
jgi:hypothetical protein